MVTYAIIIIAKYTATKMTKFTPIIEISILVADQNGEKSIKVLAHPIGTNLVIHKNLSGLFSLSDRQSGRYIEQFRSVGKAIVVGELLNELFNMNSTKDVQFNGRLIYRVLKECELMTNKEIKSKEGCYWYGLPSN